MKTITSKSEILEEKVNEQEYSERLKLAFKRDYRNRLTFQSSETREFDWEQLGINPDYVFIHDEEWKQCRLEDEGWVENDGVIYEKVDENDFNEKLKEYESDGLTKSDLLYDEEWKEIDGVIYSEISEKDKSDNNNFELGWYDHNGNLINDDLKIFEKNEGKFDFGDDVYYWDVAENLSFEEFELFIESNSAYIFEVLDEIGVDDKIINFLKNMERDLPSDDFKYLLKKISEGLFYGTTLSEILGIN